MRTILAKNPSGELVYHTRAKARLSDADALMFAAIKHVLDNQLGAISINWYTRGPDRLRLYTGLVRPTGPKGRNEYNPSGDYLEFSMA